MRVPPQPGRLDELTAVDALAQLSFLVQGELERRADEHGLSLIQARLLGVLRDREPTMKELSQLLALDKSSVSGLVGRAERHGLVLRAPSTIDRRAVRVGLTEEGRRHVHEVAALFERDVTAILGHLAPPEQAVLSGLVARLLVAHARARGVDLFDTVELPDPS